LGLITGSDVDLRLLSSSQSEQPVHVPTAQHSLKNLSEAILQLRVEVQDGKLPIENTTRPLVHLYISIEIAVQLPSTLSAPVHVIARSASSWG
jgi:hypothetical protein